MPVDVVLNWSSIRWDANVHLSHEFWASHTSVVLENLSFKFIVGFRSEDTVFSS